MELLEREWFWALGLMRVIVLAQMIVRQEVLRDSLRNRKDVRARSRRRCQLEGQAIFQTSKEEWLARTKERLRALASGDENWWLARLLLVRDARRSDETLALGRSCSSGGWNAHHSFSRYLTCLAEKRITTASIAKRSHR